MKNLFIYIILVFLVASFGTAGSFTSPAFQEQSTVQDTIQATIAEKDSSGFFSKIWEAITGLFQKDKEKPVKPNRKIEKRSVHYDDLKTYEKFGARNEAFWDSLWQLSYTPYISEGKLKEDIEVFGWHPYWMGSAYTSYNFNLLSSVSYFSYEINPETGSYFTVNDWKTTRLVDMAKAYKKDVFLTVTNFGEKNNQHFFKNRKAQTTSVDSIVQMVKYRDADGVTLNFDLVPKKVRKEYNSYIIELSNRLKAEKLQLNLAIPPVDVDLIYDFNTLANYVDRFVVMGYGYYGEGSRFAGPESPLDKGELWGNSTLKESVSAYIKDGIPAGKMVLSVPYLGASWQTKKASVPSKCLAYYGQLPYRTIKSEYTIDPVLETQSSSLYYLFPDLEEGTVNQVWLDDSLSLAKKYDLITSQKLKGLSIWALGYDNGYTELWQLLEAKFGAAKAKSPEETTTDSTATQTPADSTETISISQDSLQQLRDKMKDSILAEVSSLVSSSPTGVSTLPDSNDSISLKLKKEVFGWHPYWNEDRYTRYRYDLLTSISYFSYEINPANGNYKTIHDWETTPMVDLARQNNCKVYLSVTCLTEENSRTFLSSFKAQQNSLQAIIDAVKLRDADGVTLNIEAVPGELNHNLSLYVIGLSNALKAEGLKFNMTIPAVDSRNAYAVEDLIHHVDQFIVMGYNYYGKGGTTAGPEAPLRSGDLWSVGSLESTVASYLGRGIPKEQLILALPYYGSVWDSPYSIIPSGNSTFVKHITYTDARKKYINKPKYDTISYTGYYITPNTAGNNYTQVWIDDEETLAKKYDFILENDLNGLGIWALGYDDGYNDLWNLVEDKFLTPEAEEEQKTEEDVAQGFIAKIKGILALLRENQNLLVFLLSVILVVFLIGLLMAMINPKIVESLMSNKAFQVAFISIFLASFIAIFRLEKYIEDSEIVFILGGVIGAIAIYLLQNMIIKKINQKP